MLVLRANFHINFHHSSEIHRSEAILIDQLEVSTCSLWRLRLSDFLLAVFKRVKNLLFWKITSIPKLTSASLTFRLCVRHTVLYYLRALIWRLETSNVWLGILRRWSFLMAFLLLRRCCWWCLFLHYSNTANSMQNVRQSNKEII